MSQIPLPVSSGLDSLRRAISAWLIVRGLAYVSLVLTAVVLLSMLFDGAFHMDVAQRRVFLGLMITAVAGAVWHFLLRPIQVRLSNEALCMKVEKKHRQLGQSVISAIEFARGFDAERLGVSPSMVDATVRRGAEAAGTVKFYDVIDRESQRKHMAIAGGSLLFLAGVIVAGTMLFPDTMSLWARRAFLLSSDEWPRQTDLIIEGLQDDGTVAFPRGDDWDQFVVAEGVKPNAVFIDYRPKGGGRASREQMAKVADGRYKFSFKSVINEFEFRVRGGDHTTRWVRVVLTDRPVVDDLQLTLTLPQYTGVGTRPLQLGEGSYYALKGSSIRIEGIARKALASATLSQGNDQVAALTLAPLEPAVGDKDKTPRTGFSGQISAAQMTSGTYLIDIVDTVGLRAKRPTRFTVKVVPDRVPTVRSSLYGIGGMITPNATVPVRTNFSDDYAIVKSQLVWNVPAAENEPSPGGEEAFPKLEMNRDNSAFHEHAFEIEPLGLVPGQNLHFHVEAVDNDTVSGPKTGSSAPFQLRVVEPKELRDELIRKEQDFRIEFERLLSDQRDFKTEGAVVLNRLDEEKKIDINDGDRAALGTAEKRQRKVGNRAIALAERFDLILAEHINNKLMDPHGPMARRLQIGVIEPLRNLKNREVAVAADWLDHARKSGMSIKERKEALANAARFQDQVIAKLEKVLTYLRKMEGYQEALRLLNEITGEEEELYEKTKQKLDDMWKE